MDSDKTNAELISEFLSQLIFWAIIVWVIYDLWNHVISPAFTEFQIDWWHALLISLLTSNWWGKLLVSIRK